MYRQLWGGRAVGRAAGPGQDPPLVVSLTLPVYFFFFLTPPELA